MNIYDIWFSNQNIENDKKLKLLEKYTAEEIWNFSNLKNKNLDEEKKHFEIMQKENIKLISVKDFEYPHKLQVLPDKPAFLYLKGNEEILDEDSVAIVGCRMATALGKQTARSIARELANRNINIVSGLAVGIDKYAHLGALDSEIGKTIAVLGGSIESSRIYPYENMKVYERILESGGAVISEYGIGAIPEKEHFPRRNRIISGLSNKIIVVEAKRKSGALITADWALEQGKDVFAVPGSLSSKNSVGTNNLIKEGAYLFSEIEDIFN